MKWFKHYSDFQSIEGIQKIKNKLGFAGLGRLFLLMELIAQRMKRTNKSEPRLVISEKDLTHMWGSKRDVMKMILGCFADHLEIIWESSNNILTIVYPKMLELKDSRNKRVPTITQKGAQVDIRSKSKSKSKNIYARLLEQVYHKYPRKEGKARGMKIINKDIKTDNDLTLFEKAVNNYVTLCHVNKTELKYIKHFSTFCNGWRDYVDIKQQCDAVSRQRNGLVDMGDLVL